LVAISLQITMNASKKMDEEVAKVEDDAASAEVHTVERMARKAQKVQKVSRSELLTSFSIKAD
jgi:hypothetical protein